MTTEEMKLALLWHFRWRLQYPLVATECFIGYHAADILALRKKIAVEVEIKRNFSEVKRDLGKKQTKHWFYLNPDPSWPSSGEIPNKFYFALPSGFKDATLDKYKEMVPKPYGLIIVEDDHYKPHSCHTVKRAQYLTRRTDHLEKLKEMVSWRLTSENIDLREKLLERNK